MRFKPVITTLAVAVIFSSKLLAEPLADRNGDGLFKIEAFGDSITLGIGDNAGKSGYTGRLSTLLGVPVVNRGLAGEELAQGGLSRLVQVARSSESDSFIILEGVNDSIHLLSTEEYRRLLQISVNILHSMGKSVVLMTLPPPCCDHDGQSSITPGYSSVIRQLSQVNQTSLADLEMSWITTCDDIEKCHLYNLPEGLHPNDQGYQVIAQTIAAALLGIDIFSSEGVLQFEEALGLTPGEVLVKPLEIGE
ncbi:MAG: SGNH/GDSL hydrolase family protein [Bdellovibrionales bacterium]|nr:SGNH/GDSL hydrolase family protein [Bdellovibrionales bacterium]